MDFFQWNDHDENTQHTCYFDFTAASCMSGMPAAAHSQRWSNGSFRRDYHSCLYRQNVEKKKSNNNIIK
jgi:hypothetical protein